MTIHLQWIPSHIGIDGNELADRFAAEAAQLPNVANLALRPADLRAAVKAKAKKSWRDQFARGTKGRDVARKNPQYKPSDPWWQLGRKEQRRITLVRLGQFPVRGLWFREDDGANRCRYCGNGAETLHHIVSECEELSGVRRLVLGNGFTRERGAWGTRTEMSMLGRFLFKVRADIRV